MPRPRVADSQPTYFDMAEFNGALGRSGVGTLVRLAAAAGISVGTAKQVRSGLLPSDQVRERIARAIGVTPAVLWKPVPLPKRAAPRAPRSPEHLPVPKETTP